MLAVFSTGVPGGKAGQDIADAGVSRALDRGADPGLSWHEEDFVVVGYQRTLEMPHGLVLAREVDWNLELAATATIDLAEADLRRLKARLDHLRSDYPHLEVGSRRAEWVRPAIRVRARYVEADDGQQRACVTSLLG
jgi:hypothetical protein